MARRPVDLAALSRSVACRYADARVPVTRAAGAGSGPARSLARTRRWSTGDRARLDRLLVNLVDNAVRYAKSAVTVAVRRGTARGRS